ncbi:MAG: peptidylprolyl isomerase [Eubacteriales bacterium]
MKKNRLRAFAILCALVFFLNGLFGCSASRPIKGTEEELAVVGKVGDFDVLYEEFRFVTVNYKKMLEEEYGEGIWENAESAEKYRAELEDLVYRNLTANYAVLSLCAEVGISIEEKEIQKAVQDRLDELFDELGSRKAYKVYLSENCLTDHFVRFMLGVDICYSELYYVYVYDLGLIEYDEDKLYNYIMAGNFVRTLHVYIQNDPGDDVEKNRKKAIQVREQLLAGEDIKKLIGSSVNEDLKLTTTNGYYFTRGEMIKEYEEAAFSLEIGGVSEIIETATGFYVIQRFELDPQYVLANLAQLVKNYQYAKLNEYVDERQAELVFEPNEYGRSIDLTAIE